MVSIRHKNRLFLKSAKIASPLLRMHTKISQFTHTHKIQSQAKTITKIFLPLIKKILARHGVKKYRLDID